MIASEIVRRACSEVGQYSDEQMAVEFEQFFKKQPVICEFVAQLTNGSGQIIQEMTLFLSYMVLKAVELSLPDDSRVESVTHPEIEAAYRESESWFDRMIQVEEPALEAEAASSFHSETEPHILRYVIGELNQPLEDGNYLGDEQKGEIFFLVKTVISSLSRRAIESES